MVKNKFEIICGIHTQLKFETILDGDFPFLSSILFFGCKQAWHCVRLSTEPSRHLLEKGLNGLKAHVGWGREIMKEIYTQEWAGKRELLKEHTAGTSGGSDMLDTQGSVQTLTLDQGSTWMGTPAAAVTGSDINAT